MKSVQFSDKTAKKTCSVPSSNRSLNDTEQKDCSSTLRHREDFQPVRSYSCQREPNLESLIGCCDAVSRLRHRAEDADDRRTGGQHSKTIRELEQRIMSRLDLSRDSSSRRLVGFEGHGSQSRCGSGQSSRSDFGAKLHSTYPLADGTRYGGDWNGGTGTLRSCLADGFPRIEDQFEHLQRSDGFCDGLGGDLCNQIKALGTRVELQSKVIEKLLSGLRRLEDERDAYGRIFRELRDELIVVNETIADSQLNSSLMHDVTAWKHRVTSELRQTIRSEMKRHLCRSADSEAAIGDQTKELTREVNFIKNFVSDEMKSQRRDINRILSRLGQLETDLIDALRENKSIQRRLQKLDKTVENTTQSQTVISQKLTELGRRRSGKRTERNSSEAMTREALEAISEKMKKLELKIAETEKRCTAKNSSHSKINSNAHARHTKDKLKISRSNTDDVTDLSASASLTSLTADDSLSIDRKKPGDGDQTVDTESSIPPMDSLDETSESSIMKVQQQQTRESAAGVKRSSEVTTQQDEGGAEDFDFMTSFPAMNSFDLINETSVAEIQRTRRGSTEVTRPAEVTHSNQPTGNARPDCATSHCSSSSISSSSSSSSSCTITSSACSNTSDASRHAKS